MRVICVLFLLGFLVYGNAINHPFVHDDVVFIVENPNIARLDPASFLSASGGAPSGFSIINSYFRPLLELVNRILYRTLGPEPSGFHLFNILLHIANACLVWLIVNVLTENRRGISLAAAVFFLIHPVQSEAVACISGISNLAFTGLCLWSFYCYLVATRERGRGAYYILSLFLFFLALLAKEQSAVFPAVVLCYEFIFRRDSFKKLFTGPRRAAGPFIVLAAYFLLRKMLFGSAFKLAIESSREFFLIWMAVPRSILNYLGLIFFPRDLHYYRSQDVLLPFMGPVFILLAVILAVGLLVRLTPGPQKKWMQFGICWFVLILLPVLNFIPMINEYSLIMTAEHFLYMPLIGVILFMAGAADHWLKGSQARTAAMVIFAVVGIVWAVQTGRQNMIWRGEVPLYERTLRFEKNFGRVHFLLAKAYGNAGRYAEAIRHDYKALGIMQEYRLKAEHPTAKDLYADIINQINYHLGYCHEQMGDIKEALSYYTRVLDAGGDDKQVHYVTGIAYLKLDNPHMAAKHLEKTLALDKNNLSVMNALAIIYQQTGYLERAGELLKTVAEKDPLSASARRNYEEFLRKHGESVQ